MAGEDHVGYFFGPMHLTSEMTEKQLKSDFIWETQRINDWFKSNKVGNGWSMAKKNVYGLYKDYQRFIRPQRDSVALDKMVGSIFNCRFEIIERKNVIMIYKGGDGDKDFAYNYFYCNDGQYYPAQVYMDDHTHFTTPPKERRVLVLKFDPVHGQLYDSPACYQYAPYLPLYNITFTDEEMKTMTMTPKEYELAKLMDSQPPAYSSVVS